MALLETRGGTGYTFLAFRSFLTGGFDVVQQALNTWRFENEPGDGELPFLGGGIGYFPTISAGRSRKFRRARWTS